jgi:hypothetical protein
MSRIRHAICARLAASATRLKSRRNTSVLGCFVGWGHGGTKACDGDDCVEDDEAIDELLLLRCAAMGDEMGASIVCVGTSVVDVWLGDPDGDSRWCDV